MRSLILSTLLATSAASLVASDARAGTLFGATWTTTIQGGLDLTVNQGVRMTITQDGATCSYAGLNGEVKVDQVIGCPSAGLSATGLSSSTNYSVSLTVPAFSLDQFATTAAIPVHTTAAFGPGVQVIAGNATKATATQGVSGRVTAKIGAHTKGSMYAVGMTTLLKVPLSVGKKGRYTNYFMVLGKLHYLTVDFYDWTPGSKTFTGLSSKYAPLMTPTLTVKGSFNLTGGFPYQGGAGGTVTLVSPSKLTVVGPLIFRKTVSLTTLKLTFVPEPSTLLLLGAAALALLGAGTRRRN